MRDMYGLWAESGTNKARNVQKRQHKSVDLCLLCKICHLLFICCISWLPAWLQYVCYVYKNVLHALSHALLYVDELNFPG